jgi:hypothetical protein
MVISHRINCAVVSAMVAQEYNSSLSIQHIFDDEIVWVVPRNIPEKVIEEILTERTAPSNGYEAMNRYVYVGPGIPWSSYSDNWFRSKLPNAVPYFSCMTNQAAVDLVAGGMATCHSPFSLLPNLSQDVLSKVKYFRLNEYKRKAALIMPKHLLSLSPFAKFGKQISNYFSESELTQKLLEEMHDLPDGNC